MVSAGKRLRRLEQDCNTCAKHLGESAKSGASALKDFGPDLQNVGESCPGTASSLASCPRSVPDKPSTIPQANTAPYPRSVPDEPSSIPYVSTGLRVSSLAAYPGQYRTSPSKRVAPYSIIADDSRIRLGATRA
eukprot:1805446-Rhodomonas_salina.1